MMESNRKTLLESTEKLRFLHYSSAKKTHTIAQRFLNGSIADSQDPDLLALNLNHNQAFFPMLSQEGSILSRSTEPAIRDFVKYISSLIDDDEYFSELVAALMEIEFYQKKEKAFDKSDSLAKIFLFEEVKRYAEKHNVETNDLPIPYKMHFQSLLVNNDIKRWIMYSNEVLEDAINNFLAFRLNWSKEKHHAEIEAIHPDIKEMSLNTRSSISLYALILDYKSENKENASSQRDEKREKEFAYLEAHKVKITKEMAKEFEKKYKASYFLFFHWPSKATGNLFKRLKELEKQDYSDEKRAALIWNYLQNESNKGRRAYRIAESSFSQIFNLETKVPLEEDKPRVFRK